MEAIFGRTTTMSAFAFRFDRRACATDKTWHLMTGRGRGFGRGWRGGFGPGMHGFFGPGPRAGRGDIRAAILRLLHEGPMHGYQIMRELAERSGGVWRPSPGSVYPTLQQLQDEGLVRGVEADGGRRTFELTEEGEAALEDAGRRAPWDAVADDTESAFVELRDLAFQVMAATRQVVHAGDVAHVERAKDVLRETRQRLYRILADDQTTPPTPD
jgi:DNA-binding PadR family transcriptional regulator